MADKRRWKTLSAATKRLLGENPDEHTGLEFKQDPRGVTDELLATLANAVALEDLTNATILVGVGERRHRGLVRGEVIGLDGDLHNIAEQIQQRASMTQPVPVKVEVFEENVASRPILRVVVTPRLPPHYDQKGRRSTRQGTTTRAMRDDEVLRLLEARETGRFRAVAAEAADLMMGDLRVVQQEHLEQLEQQVQWQAHEADMDARDNFDIIVSRIDDLEVAINEVPDLVADQHSMEYVWLALMNIRRNGAFALSMRLNELPADVVDALQRVLNTEVDVHEYARNRLELDAWRDLIPITVEGSRDELTNAARKVITARLTERLGTPKIDLRAIREELERRQRRTARGKPSKAKRRS
jgi:hypothetical protein